MTTIDELLDAQRHIASRDQLVAAVGRVRTDAEIRRGDLIRVFPRAYARPWQADQLTVRYLAAALSVGGEVALSHVSALAAWHLPTSTDGILHVTAYAPRHPRGVPGELVVHRTRLPLSSRWMDEMAVTEPALAVVTSWPLLDDEIRRAALIEAGRRGLLPAKTLTDLVERMYWIKGRRQLAELAALVIGGCESELELWGCLRVFDDARLAHAIRQRPVQVGNQRFRLDLAFEAERLAVELDGRRYHASPAQWQRDIDRDLILATDGWQTIRFSYARLHGDPEGCRRDVLSVLAARRARFG